MFFIVQQIYFLVFSRDQWICWWLKRPWPVRQFHWHACTCIYVCLYTHLHTCTYTHTHACAQMHTVICMNGVLFQHSHLFSLTTFDTTWHQFHQVKIYSFMHWLPFESTWLSVFFISLILSWRITIGNYKKKEIVPWWQLFKASVYWMCLWGLVTCRCVVVNFISWCLRKCVVPAIYTETAARRYQQI